MSYLGNISCFKRTWKLAVIINLGFLLLGVWWILAHTQLHFCLTPSLEKKRVLLFYKTAINDIKRGDIVYIRGHDYAYLGPQPYAKRVLGLPGDPLIHEKGAIRIGEKVLPLIEKTTEGQPLTPMAHHIVPQGYFFVAGDHPRSIDSRYEEFGLIPVRKVWGREVLGW